MSAATPAINMTIEGSVYDPNPPPPPSVAPAAPFSSKEDESLFLTQLQQVTNAGGATLASADIPVVPPTQWTTDPASIPTHLPPPQPHAFARLSDQQMFPIPNIASNVAPIHWTDRVYEEFRIPLFLIFLYFLFQLPFFRQSLRHYAPLFFHADGNYNFAGLIATSVLYGGLFYLSITSITQIAQWMGHV